MGGICGTPEYMAPEAWFQDSYDGAAIDIFACGVILFQLMTAVSPFISANKDTDSLYHRIANKDYEAFWKAIEESASETFSAEFKDLINSMLAFDPNERPTIKKIKEHSWFKGPVLSSEGMKEVLSGLKEKVDAIRFENRQKEKEEAAEAKALAKQMQEAKLSASFAFTGVHVKK